MMKKINVLTGLTFLRLIAIYNLNRPKLINKIPQLQVIVFVNNPLPLTGRVRSAHISISTTVSQRKKTYSVAYKRCEFVYLFIN
jgi:hypothetical protein